MAAANAAWEVEQAEERAAAAAAARAAAQRGALAKAARATAGEAAAPAPPPGVSDHVHAAVRSLQKFSAAESKQDKGRASREFYDAFVAKKR